MTALSDGVLVRDLCVYFDVRRGLAARLGNATAPVHAVDGISLEIGPGEVLGLVGESGSGKTTLARAIVGLAPITSGTVAIRGTEIGEARTRIFRGRPHPAQMAFQDQFSSLSPRMTVGRLLDEPRAIARLGRSEAPGVDQLLAMVELPSEFATKYPHQLSGGQARRVGIARALALKPKLLIVDEPTSGLDVSAGANVINLIRALTDQLQIGCMFITHDLNVVSGIANRIAVMYLGQLVETADADSFFSDAKHPYAQALLSAVPQTDSRLRRTRILLAGDVPSPRRIPAGCRFHTRCAYALRKCEENEPLLERASEMHSVRCLRWRELPNEPRPKGGSTNSNGAVSDNVTVRVGNSADGLLN